MAPKRSAATTAAKSEAKRGRKAAEPKVEDPVVAAIGKVSKALSVAEGFAAPVRDLLTSLTAALALPQADRHAFEHESAKIVGEALETTRAAKAAKVAELEAKVAAVDTEKAATVAVAERAAALLEEKAKELAAAEEASDKLVETQNAAVEEDYAASKALEAGEAEAAAAVEQKAKLEAFLVEYNAAKETKATAAWLKDLAKVGQDFALDEHLFQTAPATLKKAPESRGDFDKVVLTNLDAQFSGALAKFQATIDTAEPAKAERAAKVAETAAKLAQANADFDAAQAVLKAAQSEVKAATVNKKATEKTLKSFDSDAKKVATELEAAKTALAAQNDVVAAFDALLTRTVAPPPVVEVAPMEVAAEAAPAEVAAA